MITDPTRMAHGVLTGIGFLCAGAIFRDGFSIHGLTTAASLWIVSALGMLFGVGMWPLAVGGTAATLVVLAALRVIELRVPAITMVDVVVRSPRAEAPSFADLSALLARLDAHATLASVRLVDGGRTLEQVLKLRDRAGGKASPEALAELLGQAPQVREFEISPRVD